MKYVYGGVIVLLVLVSAFIYLNQEQTEGTTLSIKDEVFAKEDKEVQQVVEQIVVHLTGEVHKPGVYQVAEEIRLYELIEEAGGFKDEANEDYLNLARQVFDGEQIHVPSKEEVINADSQVSVNGKININKDQVELLITLTGIGENKANAIIDYRNEHGPFKRIEDIMLVDGIKEAMFNKIKNDIVI